MSRTLFNSLNVLKVGGRVWQTGKLSYSHRVSSHVDRLGSGQTMIPTQKWGFSAIADSAQPCLMLCNAVSAQLATFR